MLRAWSMNGRRRMRVEKVKLILVALMSLIATANAESLEQCFNVASTHYQIPVKLLKAIAKTESKFNSLAVNKNSNQSYDIGVMQINSSWLRKLNQVGISQADLFDGCKNIQVGAWILASNIKQYGFNRKAIGAYNSPTSANQEKYASKVLANL